MSDRIDPPSPEHLPATGSSDPVRRIADAVLYEGYLLWPYSRSATKNQRRWTFGGVYPRAHSEGREDDPWTMQTECLVEAERGARVQVSLRFLHVIERGVHGIGREGELVPVDELTVDGERHLSWDEAVEREVATPWLELADLEEPYEVPIDVPAGSEIEELMASSGEHAGTIVRGWRPLAGSLEVARRELRPGLHRLTVRIANTSPWEGGDRQLALRQTFVSTHTALRSEDGAFASLTDPPEGLEAEAEACENSGTWPVLVGEEGQRHMLLSSPIILSDYPEIAPESPGDLFDGGEIDQLLTLSILSLTDAERREMRDSDPRARAILERTEALSEEELMRLHGAVRELQAVRTP
jgi:hypothetical protein